MRVVVIGGGPAGATCAAILAKGEVDVTLIEKEHFPRHHIGESLQPACVELLDLHLELGPAIQSAGFQRKYGALYRWGERDTPWSVLFDPRLEEDLRSINNTELRHRDYTHAWHVRRDKFDTLILHEAERRGVEILHARVTSVEPGTGITIDSGRNIPADYIIDASGQSAVIARQQGYLQVAQDLRAVALYGYFEGDASLPSALERDATLIVSLPEGWMWWIPVGPHTTSIGLVTNTLKNLPNGPSSGETLRKLATEAGLPTPPSGAISKIRVVRDWSYHSLHRHGPGWIAIGDAAGFVDPILSGGVDFAIRDACNAALCLLRLQDAPQNISLVDEYAQRATEEFQAYRKLARYWYGNNKRVDGLFWEARRAIPPRAEFLDTPLRAFVYLTSGEYSASRHYKVFIEWQERRIFQQLGVDQRALNQALKKLRRKKKRPNKGSAL